MRKFIFLFCALITAVFVGCSVDVSTESGGSTAGDSKIGFSITLPGKARAAYYTANDAVSYIIQIVKEGKEVVSKTGLPGETVTVLLESEGTYTVNVSALDENAKIIASGSTSQAVSLGSGIVPVVVHLTPEQKDSTLSLSVEIVWDTPVDTPKTSLNSAIVKAEDGATLSLAMFSLTESEYFSIDKVLTLDGGEEFDAKSATFMIKVAGVTLKNIKNIKQIIVAEGVGDGDFTLDGCEVAKVTLNGGGANSIHLRGAKVAVLNAAYDGVRIVLEETCRILSLGVQKSCHIEAPETQSFVESVIVEKNVGEVKLSGKTSIATLVTHSVVAVTVKTKIVINSQYIKIERAADKAEDVSGNVSVEEIEQETTSSDIDSVNYGVMTEDEIAQTEEDARVAESTPIDDTIPESNSDAVEIDNPGSLMLSPNSYGIRISATAPEKTLYVKFYRAEYDAEQYEADPEEMNWYTVGQYSLSSGSPFQGAISFTDYYVENGKTYTYYAKYQLKKNGAENIFSEKDTVTATAGRGLLKLPDAVTINYQKKNCEVSVEGYGVMSNVHDSNNGMEIIANLRPAGGVEDDFANFTIPSELKQVGENFLTSAQMQRGAPAFNLSNVEYIGVPLEVVNAKARIAVARNDVKCYWYSISTELKGGIGFTDGKITFEQEELPFKIEDASTGITIEVDTSKIEDVNNFRINVSKAYDNGFWYVRPTNKNTANLPEAVYKITDSAVTPGEKCKIQVDFRKYYADEVYSDITVKTFTVSYVPKTGNGAPVWSENTTATYDEYTQSAYITSPSSTWYESNFTIPESITLNVGGEDVNLPRTSIEPKFDFRDKDNIYGSYGLNFTAYTQNEETMYVSNAFKSFNKILGVKMYQYRNGTQVKYRSEDLNIQIDYQPSQSCFTLISGFPESITAKDIYTGKKYRIVDTENLTGIISFSDVTAANAKVTISGTLTAPTIVRVGYDYVPVASPDENGKTEFTTEEIVKKGYWDDNGEWHDVDSDTYTRTINTTAWAYFSTNRIYISGLGDMYFTMPSATTIKLTK